MRVMAERKARKQMKKMLAGVENANGIPNIQRGTHKKERDILARNMSDHQGNYIKPSTLVEPAMILASYNAVRILMKKVGRRSLIFWGIRGQSCTATLSC